MGLTVTGDFAGLANFQGRLAGAAGLPRRVAIEAIPELKALVAEEFASGEDPYGNPWAPLKDGGDPLQPLADEVKTTLVGGTTIRVSTSSYLNFHHHGTHNIAKRTAAKKLRNELKAAYAGAKDAGKLQGKAGRGLRASFAAEKKSVKANAASISTASGVHDPERPVIPNDAASIPQPWADVLEKIADRVLATLGAE